MSKRVVVTGVGAISPVGLDANESWSSIKNGKLETRRINRARKQKLSEDIFSIVSIEDKVTRVGQAYIYGYTKSFFDVAVKSVGADAVTAVKLAVDGAVIEAVVFTNCFLK